MRGLATVRDDLSTPVISASENPPSVLIRSRWPTYDEDMIADVVEILRSGRVNALHHGERCRAFEQAFAGRCAVPHAIALANGTLALELALRALGIGPGDDVVVPARSFIASASCVSAVGARPVFADVDADSQTLNAATIAAALTSRTRAVIIVHLAGWPCPIDEIAALAKARGLLIIEDCAQAHGATVDGRPVGSFGDAAAFSFCTDKIISTGGEGGLLVMRDAEVWARAWAHKDHGKAPAASSRPSAGGTFRWLHDTLGSNYRMTEMQAAIGLRQLDRLDEWIATRRRNARILDNHLADLPGLRVPQQPLGIGHSYYKYYAFVRPERLNTGWSRDRIIGEVNARGVPCGSGICPEIYREQAFVGSPSAPAAALPISAWLGETSLMLPVDHTLNADEIDIMGRILVSVMTDATAQ